MLARARAAREWGFYEGKLLRDGGAEEALTELLLYIGSHRQRKGWVALAASRPVFRKLNAIDPDEEILQVQAWDEAGQRHTRLGHDLPWAIVSVSTLAVPHELTHCKCIFAVGVRFHAESVVAMIKHRVDDGCPHYYVEVYDWIARCSELSECVALLDTIEPDRLMRDHEARLLVEYWRACLGLTQLCDWPRRAYILRKVAWAQLDIL